MVVLREPCEHTTKGTHTSIPVQDYHPLTREAFHAILVATAEDRHNYAEAMHRMHQAIAGAECPKQYSGPVGDRRYVLEHEFVVAFRAHQLLADGVEDRLWELLTGEYAEAYATLIAEVNSSPEMLRNRDTQ
jgi:hypothetical protein